MTKSQDPNPKGGGICERTSLFLGFGAWSLGFRSMVIGISARCGKIPQTRTHMHLRKCPACHDMVGAESVVCPRCGENFRKAMIRKISLRGFALLLLAWCVSHFFFKRF
jgi:hypothetical protein